MTKHLRRLGVLLLLLAGGLGNAMAQALLEPPLGLRWGDSPEKLIVLASKDSLDVTISLPGDQPAIRVVTVASKKALIAGTAANAVEGRFLNGKLFEVTLHHRDREASADLMETRFQSLRKQINLDHGALLANQQQRVVENQFVTRSQSFHREPVNGLFLLLAFTEVEDRLRKTKDATFSLMYRNENFMKEISKER